MEEYKQIQDTSPDATPQKFSLKCKILSSLTVVILILVVVGLSLFYGWLPDYVQQRIDDSKIRQENSILTDPQTITVQVESTLIPSSVPVSGKLKSSIVTLSFCSAANCSIEDPTSVFGTIRIPDVSFGSGDHSTYLNETLLITNFTVFKDFSRNLFEFPNATTYIRGSFDVDIDLKLFTTTVSNVNYAKNLTYQGLYSLPGAFTNYWDLFVSATTGKLTMNSSFELFNPGTTSFITIGATHWEYLYPVDNQYPDLRERLGWALVDDMALLPGEFTASGIGEVDVDGVRATLVWSNLFQNLVNNKDSSLIGVCNDSPCCKLPTPGCTCMNASTVPLYNEILKDTPLFINLRGRPGDFISSVSIPKEGMHPGGNLPATILWVNSFGASLDLKSANLTFFYKGVEVANFSSGEELNVAYIPPYGSVSEITHRPVHLASYESGSISEKIFLEFLADAATGGASVTAIGKLRWHFSSLVIEIEYQQNTVIVG